MDLNTLFFGDNLHILREHIPAESVDLIYLDPPFNSKRAYNVYLSTPKGHQSDAQITAFDDTWHWGDQAEQEYSDLLRQPNTDVAELLTSLRRFLKESDMMAYLVMMTTRLLVMRQVLKPSGSLYLHCDPTASHYLKIVLDMVFGPENFRNEIIWQRINAKGNVQRKFGSIHDVIFAYSKHIGKEIWNQQYRLLGQDYVEEMYKYVEPETGRRYRLSDITAPASRASKGQIYEWKGYKLGASRVWTHAKDKMQELEDAGRLIYSATGYPNYKRYLDENLGEKLPDVWTDIKPALGGESLGYPTQKPLALLERIIQASSNPGDIVLDPFCGCGTAVHAAQKLGRSWLGIDITHLAIHLVERRMKEAFPGLQFKIHGEPKDKDAAQDLALRDKYEFQFWACSLVGAQPYKGGKKGADSGTDGIIYFQDDKTTAKKIIVSIKGGEHVHRTFIADLKNTVEREGAQIGLFVTLAEPTEPMCKEALSAGYYTNPFDEQFPKIQIMTIAELMDGRKPQYRDFTGGGASFKKAQTEKPSGEQPNLL
jgi:site-specific DNA-methyltransferase (adenine-specific)